MNQRVEKLKLILIKKQAESLEECALREVQEELGLNVKIEKYLGSYYFFWTIDPTKCSLCAVFMGTIIDSITNYTGNADTCELAFGPTWVTL
jgi:NADH pyrophosphatase NudC (nudix superfamily)